MRKSKGRQKQTTSSVRTIVLIAFGLSGFTALVYEVLWARQLILVFGSTLYAIGTITSIFMAGLAIGSLTLGRIADRSRNPLKIYAFLEGGIGIYALLTPGIFELINEFQIYLAQNFAIDFSGFSLIRLSLAFLALIIPAILMGGTLPVITRFFVRQKEELGGYVGRLYSLNTLGGAFGAFLAGFALIVLLGVMGTIYLAAAINLLIAIGIFFLCRKAVLEPVRTAVEPTPDIDQRKQKPRGSSKVAWMVLILFGFAGFAALSLEVAWSRVLVMILGSSVYAFSIILTTFLFGIALGSWIVSKFIDRQINLLYLLIGIEALIGITVILFTPFFNQLPFLFLGLYRITNGAFWPLQFSEFFLTGLVILIPTILMGAALPVTAKICTEELRKVGRSVGNVYFSNTIGAAAGSVITAFVLVPTIGLQNSILTASLIFLGIGIVLLGISYSTKRNFMILGMALLVIFVVVGFVMPDWNNRIIASAPYVYGQYYLQDSPEKADILNKMLDRQELYYKEGLQGTVSVTKGRDGTITLRIDGKADASTDVDMTTQFLAGYLPPLFHQSPKKALSIGLGSGVALGALAQDSRLQQIDAVEIEPAVVEASSYFSQYNHNAIEQPRVNLNINDARNQVLLTSEKYDIITAEPSNPWISGNSNLFTRENFKLYRKALKENGIVCQWVQMYYLSPEDYRMVIKTFLSVFPEAVLWYSPANPDSLLIGSQEPLKFYAASFERLLQNKESRHDLERTHLDDLAFFMSGFIDGETLADFTKEARVNTDNHPYLEFSAAKSLQKSKFGVIIEDIDSSLPGNEILADRIINLITDLEALKKQDLKEEVINFLVAREHIVQAEVAFYQGLESDIGIAEYRKALEINPDDVLVKERLAGILGFRVEIYYQNAMYNEALRDGNEALGLDPDLHSIHRWLGLTYFQLKQGEKALEELEIANEFYPLDEKVHFHLGLLYGIRGELDRAEKEFRIALEIDPDYYQAHNNQANVYGLRGDQEKERQELRESLRINPRQPEIRQRLRSLE